MQNSRFSPQAALERAARKLPVMLAAGKACDGIPYTAEIGRYIADKSICWWTNGFYPALMWQAAAITGQAAYADEARRACDLLDGAFKQFENLHHDVGFQFMISSSPSWREGDEKSLRRLLLAADLLASRYNPNGFIRAWNGEHVGLTIIDTMMNLPLLYWASAHTRDPRFRLIAMRHADNALIHHLRADGSAAHMVEYDPQTGEALSFPRGQGYATGTVWSRGQAWALYGFALSWRYTKVERYLTASRRAAAYFTDHLDDSFIPPCDFMQPALPDVRDQSAGAIAAAGLVELYDLTGEEAYRQTALALLRALDAAADASDDSPALLIDCATEYHTADGHHMPLIYADYFYIEALARLCGKGLHPWYSER